MKVILILLFVAGLVFIVYKFFITNPSSLKPILPSVFYETAENSDLIIIDFGSCAGGREIVTGEFGSILLEVWRENVSTCRMEYKDVQLKKSIRCLVPEGLGNLTFPKTLNGIDFSSIANYCKKI